MRERRSVVHLTSPPSGTSLPASSRSSVLFPAPLSPITARRCPAVTVSETPSSTAPSPNPLRRSHARRCDPGRESDGARAPTICERMTFLPEAGRHGQWPRREDLAGEVRRYRKLCGMHVMRHRGYHACGVDAALGQPGRSRRAHSRWRTSQARSGPLRLRCPSSPQPKSRQAKSLPSGCPQSHWRYSTNSGSTSRPTSAFDASCLTEANKRRVEPGGWVNRLLCALRATSGGRCQAAPRSGRCSGARTRSSPSG